MKNMGVVSGLLLLLIAVSCSGNEQAEGQAPEIEIYETIEQDIPIFQEFVGQTYGQKDIAIRARVTGFLEEIHFDEGRLVQKDKLLYSIESQQYEAESAAKQSEVAVARTNLAYAESDLNRIRPLAEQNAVSQSDLDGAIAKYNAAKASLRAAQANLRASNILLDYTRVKSPLTGIIGKTKAKVGDYVGQSPNPVILNTVSLIDTILVEFFLPETQYLFYAKFVITKGEKFQRAEERDNLQLILADGTVYNHKGRVKFVDRGIDPSTGAVLIQASFPNPDKLLRPGLFAKVKSKMYVDEKAIVIPQRSVMELQGVRSVYVVNNENKIERKMIKTGPTVGSFWLVEEGLNAGEKVVYEGLQKVRPEMPVKPVSAKIEHYKPQE